MAPALTGYQIVSFSHANILHCKIINTIMPKQVNQKKKLYKTVIQIEVLSEERYEGNALDVIHYDITEGHCSAILVDITRDQILEGEDSAKEVKKHGTSPEFFGMDECGSVLDDGFVV